jgi:alpha-galactosidase
VRSLIIVLVFAALPCAQTLRTQSKDLSGIWVANSTGPMGEMEFVYELKTDANGKITGTQRGPFGDSPIVDGKVTGDKVELTVETESFGSLSKSTITGTIVGEELHITPAMPGGGRGRGPGGPGPNGPGGPPMGMGGPPPGDAGPGGRPPGAGRGGPGFMSQPLIARRGIPTPSYRAASVNYASLPKIALPAVRDLPSNGLAKTPPMGWNSWNKFHTKIDDRTVREVADAMVSTGMKDAGYQYVNIDDGWEWKRDETGKILPNPNFPDMKALAAYVHSKGLKLGIYS